MTLEGVIRVALKKVFSVTFGVLFEENPLLAPPPLGSGQSSHGPTLAPDTAPDTADDWPHREMTEEEEAEFWKYTLAFQHFFEIYKI